MWSRQALAIGGRKGKERKERGRLQLGIRHSRRQHTACASCTRKATVCCQCAGRVLAAVQRTDSAKHSAARCNARANPCAVNSRA